MDSNTFKKKILRLFIYICLINSIFSFINNQKGLLSKSSFITMRFNVTGSVEILNSGFEPKPDKLYINDTQLSEYTNKITINDIKEIIKIEWNDDKVITSCKEMFYDSINVTVIDMSRFNSSLVTDMAYMFRHCVRLTSINLNGFSTSLVTTMQGMFLDDIYLWQLDVSQFDTSKVANFDGFVRNCDRLSYLDVSNFDTSNANNMATMFRECRALRFLNLSNFDTRKVTNMYGMFSFDYVLTSLILTSFNTAKVTYFAYFLESCRLLTSIDLSSFDTSSGVHFQGMFQNSGFESLDITNFRTPKGYNMEAMFNGCSKLTSLNLEYLDTHGVINMGSMFRGCQSIKSLDLSKFDTSRLLTMTYMFANCISLTSVDLSSFDTSKVTSMSNTFRNCHSLISINISNFITSNVQLMDSMFYNCTILSSLNLINFDTRKVQSMVSMFENCKTISNLNISNFYPSNCNDYSKMFAGCRDLRYVDFYNYYENASTIYTNIIQYITDRVTLCIHVDKEARIYKSYPNNLDESCLKYIETENAQTEYITENIVQTDYISESSHIENEVLAKSSAIIENEVSTKSSVIIENEVSTKLSSINNENEDTTKSSLESTISQKENILEPSSQQTNEDSIDSKIIDTSTSHNQLFSSEIIQSKNIISSISNSEIYTSNQFNPLIYNYSSTNDTFLFLGYNNSLIYDIITESLLQNYDGNNAKKIYIKGDNNQIFIITTDNNEKEIINGRIQNEKNFSMIDLGECKDLLKEKYYPNSNEDISFIILKHENITNIAGEKSVQYEIFDPITKEKLNLSICQNSNVNIYFDSKLSETTQKLIQDLEKLGYNVFNLNDPFYQDFCTKYTTEDGTDMTLADRKKYIYEKIMNEVQCQQNCEFSSYNPDNRYLECSCKVEPNINTVDYKKFSIKKLHQTFYDVLKYSNYKVIMCYNLVFNTDIFNYNKGFWIIFILFILYLTQLCIYLFKKISPLELNIARYHFKRKKPTNEKNVKSDLEKNIDIFDVKISESSLTPQYPPKKMKNIQSTKIISRNRISDKNILEVKTKESQNDKTPLSSAKKKLSNIAKYSSKTFLDTQLENKYNSDNEKNMELKRGKLDDYELNNLQFEEALILDNRNILQIFWSILKREHLILFTFFIHNDYNLYYLKFARLFFLMATEMAMNVFFFSDETMNKLYLSYGKYDFVQQIPQILYSKVLSNLIEVFLCYLSLTDNPYYKIKSLTKKDKIEIFDVIRCTKKKIIIFFIFTFLVFLFYLYLVTAFCAVYENTQIIFIKDFLSSYVLGIVQPLIIYSIPSLLRTISLKCKCKFIYKLSDSVPIF